jgi:hypothetical protein
VKGLTPNSTYLLILASAILASGCGNAVNPNRVNTGNQKNSVSAISDGGLMATVEGNFSCPLDANVLPKYDMSNDGSQHYTVCNNHTSPGEILVHGQSLTDQICVFPALTTSGAAQPILNITIQCPKVVLTGTYLNYGDLNYNAVYITEAKDAAQMYYCLQSGGNCPAFSYGQF